MDSVGRMAAWPIMELLFQIWHYVAMGLALLITLLASGHALLYKRDPRAAVLWLAWIWLVPVVGAILYLGIGINRIRHRAQTLRGRMERCQSPSSIPPVSEGQMAEFLSPDVAHLRTLVRVVNAVATRSLLPGNRIEPLVNGDAAYPAMLAAIDAATTSVSLCTYIFDHGRAGDAFVVALARAVRRGVQVRVLIDDTGARYSWPTVVPKLCEAGVRVARFLPTFAPSRFMSMNLRNHRKVLVVDGRVGFTGGMNIRDGNQVSQQPRRPVQDIQFRLEGPVVAQLQEVFAEDWLFTTQELLRGDRWFPRLELRGRVIARGISDGPDADFEKLRGVLLGALACAKHSVRIVTPYFLPDQALIAALNLAALRGVKVEIILPSESNLPFVHWAIFASLWQVLKQGCQVWLTPPPFDHSKLMLVDGSWSLIGSANWDPRSLRLNFEFNLECYGPEFAEGIEALINRKVEHARQITLAQVDGRSLPVRLRDGVARLFMPYL